jgi:phage tail sheath protein FI
MNGMDLLADVETVDVNLLFSQIMATGAALQNHVHKIAYQRKDAVAFMSPAKEATVGAINPLAGVLEFNEANGDGAITKRDSDGSYGVMDSGAVYIYDRYNDVYRFIPANGHVAGLCANTDDVAEPWFSPAGFNRGGLRSIVKLAFNPTKAQRDELYKAGINPIASFPGTGTVLFGDKTAQAKPSAFDRINVRRLFIVLEKAIATAAKFQLFELNDEFTRATFRNAVEPFLRDVQGRRGITDFMVVCDDTNNTGEVIDTNRFVADIYIKPARSINFITLNFIATRTGVDFSEVAGLSNA